MTALDAEASSDVSKSRCPLGCPSPTMEQLSGYEARDVVYLSGNDDDSIESASL